MFLIYLLQDNKDTPYIAVISILDLIMLVTAFTDIVITQAVLIEHLFVLTVFNKCMKTVIF